MVARREVVRAPVANAQDEEAVGVGPSKEREREAIWREVVHLVQVLLVRLRVGGLRQNGARARRRRAAQSPRRTAPLRLRTWCSATESTRGLPVRVCWTNKPRTRDEKGPRSPVE